MNDNFQSEIYEMRNHKRWRRIERRRIPFPHVNTKLNLSTLKRRDGKNEEHWKCNFLHVFFFSSLPSTSDIETIAAAPDVSDQIATKLVRNEKNWIGKNVCECVFDSKCLTLNIFFLHLFLVSIRLHKRNSIRMIFFSFFFLLLSLTSLCLIVRQQVHTHWWETCMHDNRRSSIKCHDKVIRIHSFLRGAK